MAQHDMAWLSTARCRTWVGGSARTSHAPPAHPSTHCPPGCRAGLGADPPTCPPRCRAGLRLRGHGPPAACTLLSLRLGTPHPTKHSWGVSTPSASSCSGGGMPPSSRLCRRAEHPAAIWVPASSQLTLWKGRRGRGALSCAPSTHVPVLELAQRLAAIALGVLRATCCGEAQGTVRPCCVPAACPWLQRCPRAPAVAPAALPGALC